MEEEEEEEEKGDRNLAVVNVGTVGVANHEPPARCTDSSSREHCRSVNSERRREEEPDGNGGGAVVVCSDFDELCRAGEEEQTGDGNGATGTKRK